MSADPQQQPNSVKARLPKSLSFSIFALVALTVLTIAALFISLARGAIALQGGEDVNDSIEDKGSRIFLTFVIFAVFVGLTAPDTLKSNERGGSLATSWLGNGAAMLILAGLALSVSLLLRWFFGADERKLQREHSAAPHGTDSPRSASPQQTTFQPRPEPLPWPRFQDGRLFPADQQGQPDFEAARRMQLPSQAPVPPAAPTAQASPAPQPPTPQAQAPLR